jgi:uncharacterized protein (AIM24 family)
MHPSWHPDPTGRHELRYWDGSVWTDHVADRGVQAMDPLIPQPDPTPQADPAPQAAAAEPTLDPAAMASFRDAASQQSSQQSEASPFGQEQDAADVTRVSTRETTEAPEGQEPERTEDHEPSEPEQPSAYAADPYGATGPVPQAAPPQAAPPQSPPPQGPPAGQGSGPDPAAVAAQGFTGDAFAGISGDLIDGRFSERSGAGVELQNNRMLRVRVIEPFMARQGSMVAYQGDVVFNYQGGGAAKFLKKAFTGEGLALMRVEGSGDVFLADQGHHVHVLHLRDSGISISGSSVLAFSAGLDWNIERVKGGSIATGGLFNTTVRGTGWVAITTDGEPVVLNAGEAATFADTDAVVAWSAHLQTSLRSTMSAGALIGRGSGEALQVTFAGQGFVIVQPSEGAKVPPHSH